jgi:hypothetical protein
MAKAGRRENLDESWGMTILGSKPVILKAVLQQRHYHLAPPSRMMNARRLIASPYCREADYHILN